MNPPSTFVCPILQELMQNPVLAADGFSYEREAIHKWFVLGRKTSPITNQPLECIQVFPNRGLKAAIQEYVEEQRKCIKETLLNTLGKVRGNGSCHDDTNAALLQYSFSNIEYTILDTYAILHAIVTSWKDDADVCNAVVDALVQMIDDDNQQDSNDQGSHAARLHQLDFFGVVMDVMRRFEAMATTQACGLRYIQRYSRANGFLKVASIQKFRACDLVVGAMKQHVLDKAVQLEGVKAIELLGMNFPANVFKSTLSKVLVSALGNFGDDAEVIVGVCRAILYVNTGACARLCHLGLCRKVAEATLVFPRDEHLHKACCQALAKISHSKTHCDESVCDAVLTTLQDFLQNTEVAKVACAAVTRLAFWQRYATRLGNADGCDMVLTCLRKGFDTNDPDEDLVTQSVHALAMLTSEDAQNRGTLATPQAYRDILQALTLFYEHRKIVVYGLRTLCHLGAHTPEFATLGEEKWGASFKVIRAMRAHLSEEDVQEAGWTFLDLLARNKPNTLDAMVLDQL